MRKKIFCLLAAACMVLSLSAQKLTGYVKDTAGNFLPYSSVSIKGKDLTTTANAEGKFSFALAPGHYTLVCQHVGFEKQEKKVEIGNEHLSVEFIMKEYNTTLTEVVVKKGEDPAYEIIRNAIRKRPDHKKELDRFSVEVYTKGQLRLRDFPKKFMGSEVDFEDGDTSKKKIVFLSETVSQYSVEKPDKQKVEVVASKVSGMTDAYGLSAPNILSFYENNIRLGNVNPRGFVSPVADNALNFYRYKYEGAFTEDGREVSRIKVIPRRKFEPVFSGYINIIENEWRIHSLELQVTKDYAVQFFDTLRVEQLLVPVGNIWVVKSQVLYPAIKMFGFDAHGSFANVYSNYNLAPEFPKGYFTSTVMKYTDSSNKRPIDYWETNRPIVLQQDEINDYRKKDSLEKLRKTPAYRDSMDRKYNRVEVLELLLTGVNFYRSKDRRSISISPLIETLSYNTVEGAVANLKISYNKYLDTTGMGRRSYTVATRLRYGFSNEHFNPGVSLEYRNKMNSTEFSMLSVYGGSDVFQYNNDNPVNVLHNTVSTLFYGKNYLKIYEAGYAGIRYSKGLGGGLSMTLQADFQNRTPLHNTTDHSYAKNISFTPNLPWPLKGNVDHHQAMIASFQVRWRPGSKYIEFPNQKVSMGSKYPAFQLQLTQGIGGLLSSDVDYTKWLAGMSDHMRLRMLGTFNYRADVGGFLRRDRLSIPDFVHFKGNTSDVAGSFGDRFQLVPHYYFSHYSSLYCVVFTEHHFNGFITNKIPGLKQLKWNLVGGARALTIKDGRNYAEPFVGLENIFRVLRVDYVWGLEKGQPTRQGIRFGMSSALFSN